MDRINLPASIQNLANVEKLQHREIHNPVIHSIQNSESDQVRHQEAMRQPNAINQTDSLNVDPEKHNKQEKRKKKKNGQKQIDRENRGSDSGKFIDYSA